MATITFIVKVSGGKFYIDEAGNSGLTLTWRPGDTYIFDQSDSSNAGNTLRLSATSDNSGSSEYTTGVTVSGTAGSAGAKTTIITSGSTTATLYYYSGNNSGYGGTFSSANYNTSTNFNLIKPQVGKATGDWGPMVTHALDQIDQAINNITAGDIADATLVTESEGLDSSDNDTSIPTTAAVKDYVDSNESTLSLIDEDSMATDSATRPPSQQSVKAYVNAQDALMGYQGVPHIIPGVLYPGISDKQLDGTTALAASTTGPGGSTVASSKYGTVQSDGRMYYYTDIKGSKPIKDPRIGGHFGSQRHTVSSLQLLEQETATHGSDVYSVDGREWMRAVGVWINSNGGHGNSIYVNNTNSGGSDFIEIVGYFSDANIKEYTSTIHDKTVSVDGTVVGSNPNTSATTSVATPLTGRYVEAGSIINLALGQTLGIHTLKLASVNGDYLGSFYGFELIAQDTSNRNNIQIPSQDVVSYGKKFTVSGTPHYDPFTTMSYGGSGTTLSNLQSLIDTDTSLGMDAWKAGTSNYHRPWNGGRIIKWVDSSGTIKTSVNMMPPNAQNIGTTASNAVSDAHVIAGTNDDAINFNTSAIDHSQAEVAKTFHWREFGNGAGNQGNSVDGSMQDASMHNAAGSFRYVMDDGLTSMSAEDVIGESGSGGLQFAGNSDYIYVTFIGTGISLKTTTGGDYTHKATIDGIDLVTSGHATATHLDIAQNLPYGTHIFKWERIATSGSGDTKILELTFHQPKKPPIPEDACVLADYMLMADFVPQTSKGIDKISKGVRRCSVSRDVFCDEIDGNAFSFAQDVSYASGFRLRLDGGADNADSMKLRIPSFGTNIVHIGYASPTRSQIYIDSSSQTTTDDPDSNSNGSFQSIATNKDLGLYNWGINAVTGQNGATAGFDLATPIHTPHHYQTFETPYLHELIGGDRNMEQTNLVCSSDGKTWDQITRDTSYISSKSKVQMTKGDSDIGSSVTALVYTVCRGAFSTYTHAFNKDFALAYDRFICLKNGVYKLIFNGQTAGGSLYMEISIKVNGVTQAIREQNADSGSRASSALELSIHLKRGDTVSFWANNMEASHGSYWGWVQIDEI